ncbi:hypothetical protein Mmc1_0096 [Magnetococcus marinus MC-1]|uniref:Uncharacterized protein n=1 Tax=Magnetococcus marinus (strain ATCC BAA-1437 / JCM 17883 / MC-1) TaxID=156889 RepID=A0L3T2_MAGMM|nr:hypothetical protein Mmc1_0096 [Magnetococcus marinus MC-1]
MGAVWVPTTVCSIKPVKTQGSHRFRPAGGDFPLRVLLLIFWARPSLRELSGLFLPLSNQRATLLIPYWGSLASFSKEAPIGDAKCPCGVSVRAVVGKWRGSPPSHSVSKRGFHPSHLGPNRPPRWRVTSLPYAPYRTPTKPVLS